MDAGLDRFRYFLGTVLLSVQNLEYRYSSNDVDECTGCSISDLQHNIPALITLDDYQQLLRTIGNDQSALYRLESFPKISLPSSKTLPCLHGRFRIETAKLRLDSSNVWWAIDLYNSDTPVTTLTRIRQHYQRHLPVSDGEKYIHIRHYERRLISSEEKKWRALLSKSKIKCLNQLLRNPWLCDRLDKLESFRALWMNFQLSAVPPILSWRCVQEVEFYLQKMYDMWYSFSAGEGYLCDEITVHRLQGLAPRWSSHDRSTINALFDANKVFFRVKDPHIRDQIRSRVLGVGGIILGFRTFYKHVKVLEPVMLRLRELFHHGELHPNGRASRYPKRPPSVKDILFRRCYRNPAPSDSRCLVQYSDFDERLIRVKDPAMSAYVQLCLFLLRNAPISPITLRRKEDEEVGMFDQPSYVIRLGQLAHRLGFESDHILDLCRRDADLSDIHQNMLQERPSRLYAAIWTERSEQASLRKQGQAIFKPLTELCTYPIGTSSGEDNVAVDVKMALFLPNVWNALAGGGAHTLTTFGRLTLILMSFFEGMDEAPVMDDNLPPPGDARPQGDVRPSDLRDAPEQPSHHPVDTNGSTPNDTETRLVTFESVVGVDASGPSPRTDHQEPPGSSTYSSSPVPLEHLQVSLRKPTSEITFWHLQSMYPPIAKHTCEPLPALMKRVVNAIRRECDTPNFFMQYRDGYRSCSPHEILRRRGQSNRNDHVFYAATADVKQILSQRMNIVNPFNPIKPQRLRSVNPFRPFKLQRLHIYSANSEQGSIVNPEQGSIVNPEQGSIVNPEQGSIVNPEQGSIVNPEQGIIVFDPEQRSTVNPEQRGSVNPEQGSSSIPSGRRRRSSDDQSLTQFAVGTDYANKRQRLNPDPPSRGRKRSANRSPDPTSEGHPRRRPRQNSDLGSSEEL